MLLLQPSSCCDICTEEYCSDTSDRSPHSIECGHIFCGLCILSFNPKRCPMCRASFHRITRLRVEAGSSPASPLALRRHNAQCAMCSSSIYGVRYKCLECPDYDTCAACFDLTLKNHPGHSFIIIHNPLDCINRSRRAVEHNVNCRNCKQRVLGVRYQCTECADYDLCASCEALPIPVHSPAHHMVKIKYANSAACASPWRARVRGPRPMTQANRRLSRLLEDDMTIPIQPLQAKPRRTHREQSPPRAQMNAKPPGSMIVPIQPLQVKTRRARHEQSLLRAQTNAPPPRSTPPPHETGLWEIELERRYPYTYTVCLRRPVGSGTRLSNILEEQPRIIINRPPVPAPRDMGLPPESPPAESPAESLTPCTCRLCHPEIPRPGRLKQYASKVGSLVHAGGTSGILAN